MEKLTLAMVLKQDAKISTAILKAAIVSPIIDETKEKQKQILDLKNIKEENLKLVVKL